MNSILEYLVSAAGRNPEQVALADRERSLTYGELLRQSRAVGAYLKERVPAGSAVGVWAVRNVDTPVLFYGAVWAGCYYVPLDPGLRSGKLQKILDDCRPPVILTGDGAAPKLELSFSGAWVPLAHALACAAGQPDPVPGQDPDAPLYMVYTSGSTGTPKGVLKSHGAMVSFIEAYTETFPFSTGEVLGNQTPFCFDASAKDLYLALRLGARIEILDTGLFSFPVKLIEYMNQRGVTFISWVPSALAIVTQLNTFQEVKPTTLKWVLFVGEVFPMKQLNRWRAALPEVRFVNLYGSSELAGVCCYYEVRGEFADTDTLPIGGPLGNSRVYLVRDGQVLAAPREIGELYVASPALALCYYRDEEKTAAAFRTVELRPGEPERVFCTGDLAQYTPDGLLVFAARRDHQIKHMGHRIELGEIETAAGALDEVARCCCVYDRERSRIVLFCQLTAGSGATGRDILHALKEQLSDYMVPNRVRILPELPLNPNGKIDRVALAQMLSK